MASPATGDGRIVISKEHAMTTDNRGNERRLVYKWVDSPIGRLQAGGDR